MSMWEGFDDEAWSARPADHRARWQRLHIYLTGNDPWNKPPLGGSAGGGSLSATMQLAIRTAVLGGGS
jgi:hypothetical protein